MKNKHYDKKMYRLIAILNQLNSARFVRTRDLAEEFNTDIRTIQRDISLLNMAGFPLDGEDGKYSFGEGFSLKKIKVTPEEKYLITLLCGIFSGANGPLQESSKNLLNKVLVQSNGRDDEGIDLSDRKRTIIEEQVKDLSKKVQVYCQDEPRSKSFDEEVDRFVIRLEEIAHDIKKNEGIELKVERQLDHEAPLLVCSVFVPVKYIEIPEKDLIFGDKLEPFKINFTKISPDSIWNRFRIEARVRLFYKFYGPFIEPKKFTCFDGLMGRFGFPMDRKVVTYESSAGTEDLLISHLTISWEKKVDIPEEEMKSAGRKKMVGWKHGKGLEIF
ncbi:MAG: HTH domain-containing protein [Candidatus Omnitrophota bacterium]